MGLIADLRKRLSGRTASAESDPVSQPAPQENPMFPLWQTMADGFRMLREAGYAKPTMSPPAAEAEITAWEQETGIRMDEDLRNWFLLANGFEFRTTASLYAIGAFGSVSDWTEYQDAVSCVVGSYIGDGSLLVLDREGHFCKLDHAFGLEPCSFKTFLTDWVLMYLEEDLGEAGFDVDMTSEEMKKRY